MKAYAIQILPERCKGCGLCREVCAKDVLEASGRFNLQGYEYFRAARPEKCVGCARCLAACPDFSLELEELGEGL